jgi:hypothetical protein
MPQTVAVSLADLVSASELRSSANVLLKMSPENVAEYANRFMRKWEDTLVEIGFHRGTKEHSAAVLALAMVNHAIFDKR